MDSKLLRLDLEILFFSSSVIGILMTVNVQRKTQKAEGVR
jgi:hypothetical protein